MLLFVVEDQHAERALRGALAAAHARGETPVVLTGDALLAMRLRRDGVDARLTTDGLTKEQMHHRDGLALEGGASAFRTADRDASTFLGTSYGRYLEYTLIPAFIRAVRNLTALDDIVEAAPAAGSALRLGLVGGGPLVDAARLLAERRGITVESFGGDLVQRAAQMIARLRAGRATRWVNNPSAIASPNPMRAPHSHRMWALTRFAMNKPLAERRADVAGLMAAWWHPDSRRWEESRQPGAAFVDAVNVMRVLRNAQSTPLPGRSLRFLSAHLRLPVEELLRDGPDARQPDIDLFSRGVLAAVGQAKSGH